MIGSSSLSLTTSTSVLPTVPTSTAWSVHLRGRHFHLDVAVLLLREAVPRAWTLSDRVCHAPVKLLVLRFVFLFVVVVLHGGVEHGLVALHLQRIVLLMVVNLVSRRPSSLRGGRQERHVAHVLRDRRVASASTTTTTESCMLARTRRECLDVELEVVREELLPYPWGHEALGC